LSAAAYYSLSEVEVQSMPSDFVKLPILHCFHCPSAFFFTSIQPLPLGTWQTPEQIVWLGPFEQNGMRKRDLFCCCLAGPCPRSHDPANWIAKACSMLNVIIVLC
jgi:hypothetical protein